MVSPLPSLLIVNPRAGPRWRSRPTLDRLCRVLETRGLEPEVRETEAPGHATELARDAAAAGRYRAVLALGGDGTQRETATGLLGTGVPLGLLPAGTANVLAPALGLPRDAVAAAGCFGVERGAPRARALDVGLLESGDRVWPFLMMASRGIDARALHRLDPGLKRRLGATAVGLQGVRELVRAAEAPFEYRCGEIAAEATFLSVCNIAGYGGVTELAPDADPFDGRLDLVAFAGLGRGPTLSLALSAVLRRHRHARYLHIGPIDEPVELPGVGSAVMQLDGDAVEVALPATLRLSDQRLQVLVP